jgi:type I restriction enzyme S subunit
MDSKAFFDNFEAIANAPGGIARLRDLILYLAVRGKLVDQRKSEGVGSEFISKFSDSYEPSITPKTVPFEIPQTWAWTYLGNVSINRDNERVPISKPERETRQGAYDYYGASGVIDSFDEYLFEKPLLLIGEDGANLVNRSTPIAFMARGKYWVNNHAHVIDSTSEDALEYLAIVINQMDLKPFLTGTAQPKLNQAKLNGLQIPVPPFNEQKRIVSKVDELIALCDELETARNQRNLIRAAARKSAIDSISTATMPEELAEAWKRISNNWLTIADTPESVSSLRSLILDLAVRGKLIERLNEADWETEIQLDEVGKMIRGVTYAKAESSKSEKLGMVPLLGAANIQRNINFDGLTYVPERLIKPNQILSDGDVLICMSSGSKHLVGKTGSISLPPRASFGAFCAVFRISDRANHEYIAMFFKSPVYRKAISAASRGIGINNLRIGDIESIAFFLPGLSEQKRIVSKVDELMALCDQLEHFLLERSELSKKIAGAMAAEVVA